MLKYFRVMISRFAICGIVCLCSVLTAGLTGCAGFGYTLGSTLPPNLRSVYVPTFVNRSNEPLLEIEATKAVIQELQRDGSLKVVDKDTADFLLKVALVDCSLKPLRYDRDSGKTTAEYRLEITADIVLSRIQAKEFIVVKRVRGEFDFRPGGDLQSAKRAALPGACRDLAHDVVESVVEYWY